MINYTNNHPLLEVISSMWTIHYNNLLENPNLQEWEIQSYEDLIRKEKVFDV